MLTFALTMKEQAKFWKEEVENSLVALRQGGIILYPTATVWGLGCDASNSEAVERLNQLKKRISGKSYIVLVDDPAKLNRFVREVPDVAWDLVESAVEPMTIIYPEGINVAPNVLAEDGSLGIRVSTHPFCKLLIRRLKTPLVSTSANISGQSIPTTEAELDPAILKGIDYKVKGEFTTLSKPSTLIKLKTNGEFKILR